MPQREIQRAKGVKKHTHGNITLATCLIIAAQRFFFVALGDSKSFNYLKKKNLGAAQRAAQYQKGRKLNTSPFQLLGRSVEGV